MVALTQIGTVQLGAISLPVLASAAIAGEGGFSDGELLIGNSDGGLTAATLTAGDNITITNGDGLIEIAGSGGAGTPGGSPNDVQFNDAGSFGGLTLDDGKLLIGDTGAAPVAASLTQPAAGLTITGGAGTITFALADDLAALEAQSGTGLVARTGAAAYAQRAIAGTSNRISVSNGGGIAGNPTLDIDSGYVGQTSITTLGTIATGSWGGTTVAVDKGGTGQTSYTNGQLLIGNTSGNTLTKASLTAGTNITITPGAGSITIDASGGATPAGSDKAIQYNNAGSFGGLGPLTNGQLVIGSTGATAVAAALTAGASINITNAAGAITVAQKTPATSETAIADVAGTTSTTGVMAGLAGSFTPSKSGTVVFFATGALQNGTATRGSAVLFYYGTGSAPTQGAALTGTNTAFGTFHNIAAAGLTVPFAVVAIVSGLSVGTTYWLDLAYRSLIGGTTNLWAVSIGGFEL